jgi:hypothetical protein
MDEQKLEATEEGEDVLPYPSIVLASDTLQLSRNSSSWLPPSRNDVVEIQIRLG